MAWNNRVLWQAAERQKKAERHHVIQFRLAKNGKRNGWTELENPRKSSLFVDLCKYIPFARVFNNDGGKYIEDNAITKALGATPNSTGRFFAELCGGAAHD
jgi:hypothetical protein